MGKSLDPGRAFGGRYNVGGWESGCLMRAMNEAVRGLHDDCGCRRARCSLVLADDWCLGCELATESRLRLNEETGKVPTIGWAPQLILRRFHAP